MAVPAAAPALLILHRRRLGALAVVVGIIAVAVGFFLPLGGFSTPIGTTRFNTPLMTISVPQRGALALLTSGGDSAWDVFRHAIDHPLLTSGSLGSIVVDAALRGAVVAIAVAALLCLVFNVLPLMRGLEGVAAGFGLLGVAIAMGVVLGESSRTHALCTLASCHVDLHMGVWVMAAGFALALVGGAVGALRPLAGLIGGVSFALAGAVLGAGVAYLVTQQHVLDLPAVAAGAMH